MCSKLARRMVGTKARKSVSSRFDSVIFPTSAWQATRNVIEALFAREAKALLAKLSASSYLPLKRSAPDIAACTRQRSRSSGLRRKARFRWEIAA